MTEAERQQLAVDVARRTGLRFNVSATSNEVGEVIDLGLADLDRNEGFSVRLQLGWRSVELIFRPGNYSAQLIAEMERATPAGRKAFAALAQQSVSEGAVIAMSPNGVACDAGSPDGWPNGWRSLALSLKKSPAELETPAAKEREVRRWVLRFMSLLLALLPVEEDVSTSAGSEVIGYPEGARVSVEVNRYERDRRNRILCLQAKGYACSVCGFNFLERYGELGRDFIHVHHVTPVSALGEGYVINPIADLVPICPNCHAMIHRQMPPFSVEELRSLLLSAKAASVTS